MEYLSRSFKSVLGNQQAGTQSSGRETVRIGVLVFDLCHVTWSDPGLFVNVVSGRAAVWPCCVFDAFGRQTRCCACSQVAFKGEWCSPWYRTEDLCAINIKIYIESFCVLIHWSLALKPDKTWLFPNSPYLITLYQRSWILLLTSGFFWKLKSHFKFYPY